MSKSHGRNHRRTGSVSAASAATLHSIMSEIIRHPDPALRALGDAPRDRPVVLLHSGRFHERWARRSLLAVPDVWYVCRRPGGGGPRALLRWADGREHGAAGELTGEPFEDLRVLLGHEAFAGGRWFGYLSYDLRLAIEGEKLTRPAPDDRGWPLVAIGWARAWDEFDAVNDVKPGPAPGVGPGFTAGLRSTFPGRAAYEAAVGRVIDYIGAGDIFQVNLAQRFTTQFTGDPRRLFETLATISPAWYGAYGEFRISDLGFRMGEEADAALLSTSPELFLEMDQGHVITRPIKGTRPAWRTSDPGTPGAEIRNLEQSEKDAAELHMIVDLLRNDLGRVCRYGSVRVTDPRSIEAHPTVYHGVSTIEGKLRDDADVVDLLKATLPGGSITGAPKVRAMQIIDELEPVARGPYCGCIGWLEREACCLNIAIRTMCLRKTEKQKSRKAENSEWRVDFSVGGGIVADSDPAAEYDETITKAQAMLRALGGGE